MKKIVLIITIIISLCGAFHAEEMPIKEDPLRSQEMQFQVVDIIPIEATPVKLINVRNGPGTQYDKIGNILEGESFTITGEVPSVGWYKVVTKKGVEGYILDSLANVEGKIVYEPVEEPVEEPDSLDILQTSEYVAETENSYGNILEEIIEEERQQPGMVTEAPNQSPDTIDNNTEEIYRNCYEDVYNQPTQKSFPLYLVVVIWVTLAITGILFILLSISIVLNVRKLTKNKKVIKLELGSLDKKDDGIQTN